MGKADAVDLFELSRFILSGIVSTLGNIVAFWGARFFVTFETALLVGIFAGLIMSFTLSKLFAFNSRSWRRTGGEAARFIVVYAVGCAVYWAVAVVIQLVGLSHGTAPRMAEAVGILVGAGTMVFTSYF